MHTSILKQLHTQGPPTCFGQPRVVPQGGKIQRMNTQKVKLLEYQNQSTCIQFLTLQKCNCHVFELCILLPRRWPRVWPKRVADHYVYNCVMYLRVLLINPTKCTNFSNLFRHETTCFGQFLCSVSGDFHCTHSNGICHTACEQDQDGTSWSCSQAVSKPVWRIPLLCVQWKTPDDGQRNCPKHVEFYSKNKFEKLVHLFGFIIRLYHDARSAERKILTCILLVLLLYCI